MPELMGTLDTLVNGPEGLPPFDGVAWDYVDWRRHEEQVPRRPAPRAGGGRPGGRTGGQGGRWGTGSPGPWPPAGGCPLPQPRNWSGPGTPGRPSDTSAARSASGPATPTTRSGHANAPRATRAVQETGRFSGADGSIVTGTPLPASVNGPGRAPGGPGPQHGPAGPV